ncbi:MAG: OmpH family outer membrane protein, partial [Tannerella sp.]|jgi:outer membrane protein|nr:OmpH family outer membrane protein [Tannerella sp.]
MPEMTAVQTALENEQRQYDAQLKIFQDDYNRKFADLQAQQDTLTENIKILRMQEIEEIRTKYENFVPVAQQAMQKKQEDLIAPIREKVQKAIQDVGTENGYTYILPNDPSIILYSGPTAIDATDKVKAKLGIK